MRPLVAAVLPDAAACCLLYVAASLHVADLPRPVASCCRYQLPRNTTQHAIEKGGKGNLIQFSASGTVPEQETGPTVIPRPFDMKRARPTNAPPSEDSSSKAPKALHAVYSMDENDSDEEDVNDAFPEFASECSRATHFQAALQETMQAHWAKVTYETETALADTDITRHDLPLARIKRIMSQDSCENPQMLGRDSPAVVAYGALLAPVLYGDARCTSLFCAAPFAHPCAGCELLIRALTKRAWAFTELAGRCADAHCTTAHARPRTSQTRHMREMGCGACGASGVNISAPPMRLRHTLQMRDLLCAVMSHEGFDFLIDIVAGELTNMEAQRTVGRQSSEGEAS